MGMLLDVCCDIAALADGSIAGVSFLRVFRCPLRRVV